MVGYLGLQICGSLLLVDYNMWKPPIGWLPGIAQGQEEAEEWQTLHLHSIGPILPATRTSRVTDKV